MTFQPGHTFSPGRRLGSRNKRTAEIFHRLENRGDLDPADLLSSIVTNNQEPKELRIQAAGLLMPYKYSKFGTAPVQVYIDIPLDTSEFTHLSDAEQFLAKVAALVAHGQLDFQAGQNLSALAKNWIDAQYAREELAIKQYNAGSTEHEQTIRIEGGLPARCRCSTANRTVTPCSPPLPMLCRRLNLFPRPRRQTDSRRQSGKSRLIRKISRNSFGTLRNSWTGQGLSGS